MATLVICFAVSGNPKPTARRVREPHNSRGDPEHRVLVCRTVIHVSYLVLLLARASASVSEYPLKSPRACKLCMYMVNRA